MEYYESIEVCNIEQDTFKLWKTKRAVTVTNGKNQKKPSTIVTKMFLSETALLI